MVSYHVFKIHDKLFYIIDNQLIISTKRHKLLTIRYIKNIMKKLAFKESLSCETGLVVVPGSNDQT